MNPTVEIFSAGRHTTHAGGQVEITSADLAESAAAYDPAASEAPVVIGHPAINGPAYAWVRSLRASGGKLEAELDQVDPEFAEVVRAGRYKKISAAFYTPTSPDNPRPGKWYLRHVGFLGAAPPAIKGLRAVAFAASGDGVATIDSDIHPSPNPLPLTGGDQGEGDRKNTEQKTTAIEKEKTVDPEALKKQKEEQERIAAKLKADQAKLAADKAEFAEAQEKAKKEADDKAAVNFAEREKTLAARESALARREHGAFVEALVTEGKVLPVGKPFLVEFMAALPAEGVVEFAEADGKEPVKKPLLDGFKSWLTGLPKIVDFGERAPGAAGAADEHQALGARIAQAVTEKKEGN